MTYKYFLAAIIAAPLALAAPVSAAELKGAELVKALNGKALKCTYKGGHMDWTFEKSDPNGALFPFTVVIDGKPQASAYKLHKNGKMRHAKSNKNRKIVQNNDNSFTVSGRDIPTGTCVYR